MRYFLPLPLLRACHMLYVECETAPWALLLFVCELKPICHKSHTPQHMHTSTFLPFSPFFFVFSPPPFNRPYSQSASGIVNFIFSCRNHFVLVAADEISCNTSSGKINKIWKWITAHPHFLDAPTRERAYPFFMHLDSECFYCSPLSCFRPLISRFDFAFFSFLIFILFFSLLNAHFLQSEVTVALCMRIAGRHCNFVFLVGWLFFFAHSFAIGTAFRQCMHPSEEWNEHACVCVCMILRVCVLGFFPFLPYMWLIFTPVFSPCHSISISIGVCVVVVCLSC